MNKYNDLEFHIIQQSIFPDADKELWTAFLVLKHRYPELTYWSWDGYHCHALADYSINLVWKEDTVLDWTTKETILTTSKKIWDYSTSEVCSIWMRVNGETEKTKRLWIGKYK